MGFGFSLGLSFSVIAFVIGELLDLPFSFTLRIQGSMHVRCRCCLYGRIYPCMMDRGTMGYIFFYFSHPF
jgi:hypothetical protein